MPSESAHTCSARPNGHSALISSAHKSRSLKGAKEEYPVGNASLDFFRLALRDFDRWDRLCAQKRRLHNHPRLTRRRREPVPMGRV